MSISGPTTATPPALRKVTLRVTAGQATLDDLSVGVQDKTYDYLMTTTTEKVRVSAYLEADHEIVSNAYAQLVLDPTDEAAARFENVVIEVIPGSRTRKGIVLPGAMFAGEQLTVIVQRQPKSSGITTA